MRTTTFKPQILTVLAINLLVAIVATLIPHTLTYVRMPFVILQFVVIVWALVLTTRWIVQDY